MAELAPRRPPVIAAREWLKTLPPAGRWVLHGGPEARERAAAAWGAGFSAQSCRAVLSGSRASLWLGPDEYLLLDLAAGDDGNRASASALQAALAGTRHALVEVSHRQFALEVSGPHAELILRGGCPLDLDESAFPVGMCTRTAFAKADIVLWRTRPDAFHLEIWRSFAGYVAGLLGEISREFDPA
jgi:sarcosine oxidase, subunit gamma